VKIGFASRYDPQDQRTWSGTSYYTLNQLKRYSDVELFNYKLPKLLQEWLTAQKSINRRWFGKYTAVEFLREYAKYFSKQLTRDLKKRPVDILFVSASSQMIAYIETEIPIIYMTDATFQQLQGYYPGFSNLAAYNIREGIELDKNAFHKATHCMLGSEWNKYSAVNDYGIDASKITVVPFGANLEGIPTIIEIGAERNHSCNLLFLAVEWERKGGEIALETFRKLKQDISNASLHIVGCSPPSDLQNEEDITVIPFLDKKNKADLKQLRQLLLQTDFLLLPTRAECAGIVFSEAAAYGIPSITTDTGGVSSYVRNGINGYTLPLADGPAAYAELISSLLSDPEKLKSLKRSSRKQFEDHLNWEKWGDAFSQLMRRYT
jgi:glycosyltransferase involved in cell wall biosynthesis